MLWGVSWSEVVDESFTCCCFFCISFCFVDAIAKAHQRRFYILVISEPPERNITDSIPLWVFHPGLLRGTSSKLSHLDSIYYWLHAVYDRNGNVFHLIHEWQISCIRMFLIDFPLIHIAVRAAVQKQCNVYPPHFTTRRGATCRALTFRTCAAHWTAYFVCGARRHYFGFLRVWHTFIFPLLWWGARAVEQLPPVHLCGSVSVP